MLHKKLAHNGGSPWRPVVSYRRMDNTVGSLTQLQEQVLIGSILGDGALRRQTVGRNALLEVNHAAKYRAYVDWKFEVFRTLVRTPPMERSTNGVRRAYRFTTRSLPVLTQWHERFYFGDHGKQIRGTMPLDLQAIAVWFMDDGAKSRNGLYLNTQQFDRVSQEWLRRSLLHQWNIDTSIHRDKQYLRLWIRVPSARRMRSLLRSYVLPIFSYKLAW